MSPSPPELDETSVGATALEARAGAAVIVNAPCTHSEAQALARDIVSQGDELLPRRCRRAQSTGGSGHGGFRPHGYSGRQTRGGYAVPKAA